MLDNFSEASISSDVNVIQDILERYKNGDVVLFEGEPIIWRFATEVEFAVFTGNAPSIIDMKDNFQNSSVVDSCRQERIKFRQKALNKTTDLARQTQLLQEIKQLKTSDDFKEHHKDSCGDALGKLIICEINDILYAEGCIAHKFGTGTHQTGWFDAPHCAEIMSDGPQEAHKVIKDHERKIEVIKAVVARYGAEVNIFVSQLNFSMNVDRNGALETLQEIGTDEAFFVQEKAMAGISHAFVRAEPMMNALKAYGCSAPKEEYAVACDVGSYRGGCTIRSSQTHAEHRLLGSEPNIEEAITLVIGGAAVSLETPDNDFEKAGFKRGRIVDVPVYKDLGDNYMLVMILKKMQLNTETGELVLDEASYHDSGMVTIHDIFNEFKELKEHTTYDDYMDFACHDYDGFMRLKDETVGFFKGLHLKSNGTIDIDKQRENIEQNANYILKEHYAERILQALSEVYFTGETFRAVHHDGYPTLFGGQHNEQRLNDMACDPVLMSIYGKKGLNQRVSMLATDRTCGNVVPEAGL